MWKWMLILLVPPLVGMCQETPKPTQPQEIKSYVWVKEDAKQLDVFMQDVAAFLEKNDHFYLATCDGKGARVRPIKYTLIVDNKLLFVTSAKKEMHAQLLTNPNVELSRTAEDKSAYLRYKGIAVPCSDAAVKAKLLEAHPAFGQKFGGDLALFFVEPEMIGIFPMKGGQAKTKKFMK